MSQRCASNQGGTGTTSTRLRSSCPHLGSCVPRPYPAPMLWKEGMKEGAGDKGGKCPCVVLCCQNGQRGSCHPACCADTVLTLPRTQLACAPKGMPWRFFYCRCALDRLRPGSRFSIRFLDGADLQDFAHRRLLVGGATGRQCWCTQHLFPHTTKIFDMGRDTLASQLL